MMSNIVPEYFCFCSCYKCDKITQKRFTKIGRSLSFASECLTCGWKSKNPIKFKQLKEKIAGSPALQEYAEYNRKIVYSRTFMEENKEVVN